jgi:hypothetical protein
MTTDISQIVNVVSSGEDIRALFTAAYRKWTVMGQGAFADLFKTRNHDLNFCRAFLPNGWPVVDILESFNKLIKFLVTGGELLSPEDFIVRCKAFIGMLSQRAEKPPAVHAMERVEGTKPHVRARVNATWDRSIDYYLEQLDTGTARIKISDGNDGFIFFICISLYYQTIYAYTGFIFHQQRRRYV